jgi:hypothetical protein
MEGVRTTTSSKESFSNQAGSGNATNDGWFANSGKDERFNWSPDTVAGSGVDYFDYFHSDLGRLLLGCN